MQKKLSSLLNSQDLFGHIVKLNFNRNGNVHTTAIGGVVSIILKILYITYMISLLMKLINHDEDRTFEYEYNIDDEN